MGTRILQNSFLGGEISPAMLGRVDNGLYGIGAQLIENFIIEPQGSLITRPGFQFVCEAKDSTKPVRLIPFRFASDQTLVLVFGDKNMRIVTQGQVLMDGNKPFEIETPYSADELFQIDFTQNADIITMTTLKHPPMELRRYGATEWEFKEVTTGPTIAPPSSVSLVANYPPETEDRDKGIVTSQYVVTAIDADGKESVASQEYEVKHNFYLNGGTVTISWSAVDGAKYYRVYRSVAGIFGYLGQTEGLTITDYNDNPDMSVTPPNYSTPFESNTGIKEVRVLDGGEGYINTGEINSSYTVPANAVIPIPYVPPIYAQSGAPSNQKLHSANYTFTLRNSSGEVVSTKVIAAQSLLYRE